MDATRSRQIFAVKAAHTGIFLTISACILHIFWAGVRGRPTPWTGRAIGLALAEVLVFLLNRGRCPLTDLAESLGAEDGRVSDILLPRWFADRIPQLCTPPLLAGLVGLTWHARRRALTVR